MFFLGGVTGLNSVCFGVVLVAYFKGLLLSVLKVWLILLCFFVKLLVLIHYKGWIERYRELTCVVLDNS